MNVTAKSLGIPIIVIVVERKREVSAKRLGFPITVIAVEKSGTLVRSF